MHKWSDVGRMVKTIHELPPNAPSYQHYTMNPGRNLLVAPQAGGISFLHIPPAASQKPVDGWSIPSPPFKALDFAVYPPENIFAVAEYKER